MSLARPGRDDAGVAAGVLLVTTYAVLLVPGVTHVRDPVPEPEPSPMPA